MSGLRTRMVSEDLDFVLITESAQLRYLIGFTGSNGLLVVGSHQADFLTDPRYTTQAKAETRGAKISIVSGDLVDQLPKLKAFSKGRKKIGYQSERISEARAMKLRRVLPQALYIAIEDIVSDQMLIKDPSEIALIAEAARIADHGFTKVLECIKPGVRERDVAAELEYIMQMEGSEQTAFETIVASGPRSALPHGRASSKKIKSGDFVTLDFGATYEGYVSDITRTVIVGKPSAQQRALYEVVRRAQDAAVRRARAGMECAELDGVARRIIDRAGHGPRFGHGLGHGIGLVVHEGPSVNSRSKTVLKPGMVITIEPGIYVPGWGGVRIEDDIVVGRGKSRVLTHSDKRLIVL
ncbi:MAG: Xaa-Pro peptidase family protein [Candidatus Zixiibacteriota bacterium]